MKKLVTKCLNSCATLLFFFFLHTLHDYIALIKSRLLIYPNINLEERQRCKNLWFRKYLINQKSPDSIAGQNQSVSPVEKKSFDYFLIELCI